MTQVCQVSPVTTCFNKPWAGAARKRLSLLLGCCKLVFQGAAGQAVCNEGRLAYV